MRVQISVLDKGKHQLSWGKPILVWPQEHDWQLERLIPLHHHSTPMVRSIVYHDNCALSPIRIFLLKVLCHSHQEEKESVTIVSAMIDGEIELTPVAYCCYHVQTVDAL